MDFNNTHDRYNYIFGNTARKVQIEESTSPRKAQPQPKPKQKVRQKVLVHAVDAFDWKYTFVIILALFMIAAGALFYIHEVSRMNQMTEKITELKNEKKKLQSKQVALQSELDKVINLDKVQKYAEENLDMIFPTHDDIIYYYQDSSDYFRLYESVDEN